MIERNRNPAGRAHNALFGLATLLDGLIRLLSCGFLHTRLPITVSRWQAKRALKRLKAKAAAK